jgi:hypothetical protein
MRILFAVTHVGFLRNFESTLAALAERGHHICIATDRRQVADVLDGTPIIERLKTGFPGAFTTHNTGFYKRSAWYVFAMVVRGGLDYWRYLAPEFDAAPKLRARGRENAPSGMVWLSDLPGLRSRAGITLLRTIFTALERAIPPRREVNQLFNGQPWDLVFVTPLLYFGSQQVDYVRAARRRGIPSVLGVGSWDHLTTKGLVHEQPDRVLVWNEHQRQEAASLHGIDPSHVTVTGAQAYDHWFAMQPSTARQAFCARVGLPADRPYLLYLCSSPFIAPHEVEFVRAWARAVRGGSPALRTAGIMVRPHPQNAKQWSGVDLSEFGDAVIWPRAGANPIDLSARYEYYDSMFHSHAVVGINTSALIESGIVGRLVYSIRAEEFAGTQEGTLHFQHLKNGGLLRIADTYDEHVLQLEQSFGSVERDRAEIRDFIQGFVRPNGLDRAATPLLADAVEAAAAVDTRAQPLPWRIRAIQVALGAVAFPLDGVVFLLRTDRQFWASVVRHATRPPRLVARRLRRVAAAAWTAIRRGAWAIVRRVPRIARRSAAVPRRLMSRTLARARALRGAAASSKSDGAL